MRDEVLPLTKHRNSTINSSSSPRILACITTDDRNRSVEITSYGQTNFSIKILARSYIPRHRFCQYLWWWSTQIHVHWSFWQSLIISVGRSTDGTNTRGKGFYESTQRWCCLLQQSTSLQQGLVYFDSSSFPRSAGKGASCKVSESKREIYRSVRVRLDEDSTKLLSVEETAI